MVAGWTVGWDARIVGEDWSGFSAWVENHPWNLAFFFFGEDEGPTI